MDTSVSSFILLLPYSSSLKMRNCTWVFSRRKKKVAERQFLLWPAAVAAAQHTTTLPPLTRTTTKAVIDLNCVFTGEVHLCLSCVHHVLLVEFGKCLWKIVFKLSILLCTFYIRAVSSTQLSIYLLCFLNPSFADFRVCLNTASYNVHQSSVVQIFKDAPRSLPPAW